MRWLVLLFLLPVVSEAQTSDTTSAWRYLPLEVGNVWEYGGGILGVPRYERHEVVGDTLINGRTYFRYEHVEVNQSGSPIGERDVAYVRFDTTAAALTYWRGSDLPPSRIAFECALNADFGSFQECLLPSETEGTCTTLSLGGYGVEVNVGEDVVTTTLKSFDTQACEITSRFAAGIGWAGFDARGFSSLALQYARVGTLEYGTPFSVGIENTPPTVSHFLVYPSPTRSEITVEVRRSNPVRGRVEVLDVAGRRIAVLYEGLIGPHSLDLRSSVADLATGTYFVRVWVGDASASEPFVVVR
jgi:hypothetical protein